MTELATAAIPTASPLAALLLSGDRRPEIAVFRGVLTPTEFDVRAVEIAALTAKSAVHDLGWLRRVEVRGEDRFRWLSGMVTNMVNDLPTAGGAWNLVLNAQGRIQGDLIVWRENDALELEIAADQYERLLAHFDHFIIMDDVELVGVDPNVETAIGLTGPQAGELLHKLGLPILAEPLTSVRTVWNGVGLLIRRDYGALADHYALWVPVNAAESLWRALSEAGATPAGSAALETLRVVEGIPAYGIDMVERDLPQETSQMRALSFNKGCYLGQEIVERIRSRGNVHRHLRSVELNGPIPPSDTELTLDGKPAGQITSVAAFPSEGGVRLFALGMIRSEAEIGDRPLNYAAQQAEGTARILSAPPTFDLKG
jgi:folate-binding protein YgfZ